MGIGSGKENKKRGKVSRINKTEEEEEKGKRVEER